MELHQWSKILLLYVANDKKLERFFFFWFLQNTINSTVFYRYCAICNIFRSMLKFQLNDVTAVLAVKRKNWNSETTDVTATVLKI